MDTMPLCSGTLNEQVVLSKDTNYSNFFSDRSKLFRGDVLKTCS